MKYIRWILLAVVIAAVLTFAASQLFKGVFQEIAAQTKGKIEAGRKFGETSNEQGCLSAALQAYRQDTSTKGGLGSAFFISACLEKAKPSPGFCQGVPDRDAVLDTIQWCLETCEKQGFPDDRDCTRILQAVHKHCGRNAKG